MGVGRFTQTDPILGNRPSQHYSYAANNPLSNGDPMGTDVRFSGPSGFGDWDRANAGKYANLSFQFNMRSKKLEVLSGADAAGLTADEKALLWAIGSSESFSPEQDAGWASHIAANYKFNTDALHRTNILGKQQWGEGFELRDLNELEDYNYVMTATGKDLSGNEFRMRDTFHDLHGLYTALIRHLDSTFALTTVGEQRSINVRLRLSLNK